MELTMAFRKKIEPVLLEKPSLVVSRAEAHRKIEERIALGKEIQGRNFSSVAELDSAKNDRTKWTQYNSEYLRRAFDNESVGVSYDKVSDWGTLKINPSFRERVSSFSDGIENQITSLQSLLERLELIPELHSALEPEPIGKPETAIGTDVFIVHGHDETAKSEVARFIEKIRLNAVILHEQPNQGLTLIEKFERHAARSGFAVVLLTPDDIAAPKSDPSKTQDRARQNVILELGYFCGSLGRGRVCVLYKDGVEIPSDYFGVLYVKHDSEGAWHLRIAKELKQAGLDVDLNDAM